MTDGADLPGQRLAIQAESLYLANLLIAPGVAFAVLAWLWWRNRASSAPLARCHLDQTFWVSLWGGGLLVGCCTALVLLGGLAWQWTWVFVILYFTCVHSTLVLLGVVGLTKAMAGKVWVFPLIGPGLR